MAPVKRQAHRQNSVPNRIRFRDPNFMKKLLRVPEMCTVSTQTEAIKINSLDCVQQSKKFSRPKTTLVQQQKWPDEKLEPPSAEDKLNTRNKATQTYKVGVKRDGPESTTAQMGSLKSIMFKRRRQSVDRDRVRLRKLMEQINADPPPKWKEASAMWLDVDIVEKRIEEFEREEREMRAELKAMKENEMWQA